VLVVVMVAVAPVLMLAEEAEAVIVWLAKFTVKE
jgi:hypothetical protein